MIAPVAGEGKVKIVHQNLLFPFGGNVEEGPKNKGNWQQAANKPQDCILAASDEAVSGTEVLLTDPKPVDEVDTIHVQHVQTEEKLNYLVKTVWEWAKSLYWHQYVKVLHRNLLMGILWSMQCPKNVNLAVEGLVYFPSIEKLEGEGYVLKICIGKNLPSVDRQIW